jgi:hypothetical protein
MKEKIILQKLLKRLRKTKVINFNPETGETKTVEVQDNSKSFFNFFSTVKLPTEEEIKQIDYELEKELGSHLDTEYEMGIELIEEIIPHALEYFVGVTHDTEEYIDYMNEQLIEQQEKGEGRFKKNK